MTLRKLVPVLVLVLAAAVPLPARAVFFGNIQGGTDFPQGAVSFADQVVRYDPTILNGQPTLPNRGSDKALGAPDYDGDPCNVAAQCQSVSLGDGGSITLRFVDNALTGSDSPAFDLWIFEVGPDIEDTFVEISTDGASWSSVGKVFGSTAGIDIDAFGFGASSTFNYVRLTDDTNEGQQTGDSVGADIDAIGAISTIPVPEPASLALLLLGTTALATRRVRNDPKAH